MSRASWLWYVARFFDGRGGKGGALMFVHGIDFREKGQPCPA